MSDSGRRPLGWLLVAWGVVGVLLLTYGMGVGIGAASRAEALLTASRDALVAAEQSTRRAADALDGVADGVASAGASSQRAASLADDASATLDGLADAMTLNVFGAQPFLALSAQFASSAEEAAGLADELETLGASLTDMRTDAVDIGAELRTLADALADAGLDAGAAQLPLTPLMALLLAWIALPTIGALWIGLAILRRGGAG